MLDTFPWSTLLAMLSSTIHQKNLQYRFWGSQHNPSYQRYSQRSGPTGDGRFLAERPRQALCGALACPPILLSQLCYSIAPLRESACLCEDSA